MQTPPKIPEGLATQLGKYVPLGLALLAMVTEIFGINLSEDTLKVLGAALAPLLLTQAGRYAQGYAQQRDALSPAQDDLVDELDEIDDLVGAAEVPDEETLTTDFPEEPPTQLLPEGAVGGKPGMASDRPVT